MIKMMPELTDIPKWKDCGQNTMSNHFRDFEMYLSQHYGVKGFPLDWVVRPNLPAITWGSVTTACTQSKGKKPDFFFCQETNYICRNFTHIVPCNDALHLVCNDPKVRAEWENGSRSSHQSDTFHRDDGIVFQLAQIAFADSPGEIHFTRKEGKTLLSGRQAYFACKGQFEHGSP
jgi:hypothetical protein